MKKILLFALSALLFLSLEAQTFKKIQYNPSFNFVRFLQTDSTIANPRVLAVDSNTGLLGNVSIPLNYSNGLTFEGNTLKYGGVLTEFTVVQILDTAGFFQIMEDTFGLAMVKDSVNSNIIIGDIQFQKASFNLVGDIANLRAADELNIFSDYYNFKDANQVSHFSITDTELTIQDIELFLRDLPVYANEAAANSAGLATDRVYKTATGELRIKL